MVEDDVVGYLLKRQDQIIERLCAFLRMPSVGADPAFTGGIGEAQNFLSAWLQSMGLSDVQLLDGGGHPALYGAWEGAPGKPTILIYGHYDVVPPDPVKALVTPPFEPTIRNTRLYARGASESKDRPQLLLKRSRGFLKVRGACPVNIKVFLEGEEESGSASLRTIVDRFHPLLRADAMISADGGRASADIATINVGCRGLVELELSVKTAAKDLHSGRYGGAIRNAAHEMAQIIATLHDENGAIAVPDLIAGVPELTSDAREQTARFPFDEGEFIREVGGQVHGELGHSVREQLTLRPALDIYGVWSGYTGTGSKTIIPNVAHAKLSLRTVPGQSVKNAVGALKTHLQSVTREVLISQSMIPERGRKLSVCRPIIHSSLRRERFSGKRRARIPFLCGSARRHRSRSYSSTARHADADVWLQPPDEDAHAPNEFFHVASLAQGLSAWPRLLTALGEFDSRSLRQGERLNG